MGSGVKRFGTSCVAMGLVLAGPAYAAVQSTTVIGNGQGLAVMSLFDPALGKLLSVSAEASYTSWLPYTSYVAPVGYDHAVSGTATLGALLTFSINGTSQAQWAANAGIFTVTATGTAIWTNPADIALFAGSGSILGSAGASAPTPGTLWAGNYVPSVNYKLTYTYDNSPAVPEPATWAMMVGGFVLIGVALRVARRRTATGAGAASEV